MTVYLLLNNAFLVLIVLLRINNAPTWITICCVGAAFITALLSIYREGLLLKNMNILNEFSMELIDLIKKIKEYTGK